MKKNAIFAFSLLVYTSAIVFLVRDHAEKDVERNSLLNTKVGEQSAAAIHDVEPNSECGPVDMRDYLSFLPYNSRDDCKKIKENLESTFTWPEGYESAVEMHQSALAKKSLVEGHSGQIIEQKMVYSTIVQLPFVKTVCETGFNAGHSTLIWLSANEHTKVYSFDLGAYGHAQRMAKYLQSQYPGRLTVTWGDSTKTLPQFIQDHPEVKCDLIIVDGGHTVAIADQDFANFRKMASRTNIVVFDDYPTKPNGYAKRLASSWESLTRSGTLVEQFGCQSGAKRGFALGHFQYIC